MLTEQQKTELRSYAETLATKNAQVWNDISGLAKDMDMPASEALADWKKIHDAPYLANQDEDARLLHATRILRVQYMSRLMSSALPYELTILDHGSPASYESKKDDGTTKKGVVLRSIAWGKPLKGPSEGKENLIKLTFYDERIVQADSLERGTTYNAQLTGGLEEGVYDLSTDSTTKFDPTGMKMSVKNVLTSHFTPIPLSEVGKNISKGFNDFKLFSGGVTFSARQTSKKGNFYGRYSLVDPNLPIKTAKDIGRDATVSVMCDPELVRWTNGSEILVLGTVRAGEGDYGPTINAAVVTDVFGIPIGDSIPDTPTPTINPNGAQDISSDKAVDLSDF